MIFHNFTGVRNGWVNGMAGRQQVNQNVDINKVQEKVVILLMIFLSLLLSNIVTLFYWYLNL